MAQKSNEKKAFKVVIDGSGGIDARVRHGQDPCMTDIVNFKILPDGSLKKRAGYRKIYSFGESIRAVWCGKIGGIRKNIFLIGSSIYTIDLTSGMPNYHGSILTSDGKADFFYFSDTLYLIDGESIYEITEEYPKLVEGYVPLLGKDWPMGVAGEINEPLNILNSRARITYRAGDDPVYYLCPMYPVKSIEKIYKNGSLLSNDSYAYNPTTNLIRVNGVSPGDFFDVSLTFDSSNFLTQRAALFSCTSASIFGGINSSRVFLWNGAKKNTIFTSSYVSRDSLLESQKRYSNSSDLYFMDGQNFAVGDGRYDVTAIARHYDRLLIFTDGDAWMADSSACSTEEFPVMTINSSIGCATDNGALTANNDPITLGKDGIYRWHSNTDELNDCNAYSISSQISSLLSKDFYKNAIIYFNRYSNELWVNERGSDGIVWIYNFTYKVWTKYSGINASFIFDADGSVGFTDESGIYVFDDTLSEDIIDENHKSIVASFKTGTIDFDDYEYKRIKAIHCRGDLKNTDISLSVNTDRGESKSVYLFESAPHAVITRRVSSCRLKSFHLSLTDNSQSRQTLHRFEIELK